MRPVLSGELYQVRWLGTRDAWFQKRSHALTPGPSSETNRRIHPVAAHPASPIVVTTLHRMSQAQQPTRSLQSTALHTKKGDRSSVGCDLVWRMLRVSRSVCQDAHAKAKNSAEIFGIRNQLNQAARHLWFWRQDCKGCVAV